MQYTPASKEMWNILVSCCKIFLLMKIFQSMDGKKLHRLGTADMLEKFLSKDL